MQGVQSTVKYTALKSTGYRSNVTSHSLTANVLIIADQRDMVLVSLASIHPTRNEINTSERKECYAPKLAIIQALAIDLLASVRRCI